MPSQQEKRYSHSSEMLTILRAMSASQYGSQTYDVSQCGLERKQDKFEGNNHYWTRQNRLQELCYLPAR